MTSTAHVLSPASDADILARFGHVVRRAAQAMSARTGVDVDELWSVGALGLIDAVRRFDPVRGVKLETFVHYRVRGAMLDEIRRMDRLPRRLRVRVASLERTKRTLAQDLGRTPSREEVAEALGVDAAEVDRLQEADLPPRSIDALPVAAPAPFRALDAMLVDKQRAAELRAAVATLGERHQTLLSLRYVEELTLKEIAAVLGVSEPRVCQLHHAALDKLKKALADGAG